MVVWCVVLWYGVLWYGVLWYGVALSYPDMMVFTGGGRLANFAPTFIV